jgi:predicted lipoprotein with Yx(FWY)xxD motif
MTTLKRLGAGIGAAALCASSGALLVMSPVNAGALAPAQAVAHAGRPAVVVKISAARGGFKHVLTNTSRVGRTLYTASSCSGSCLTSWPALLMPKGTSIPKGPKGLTGLGTKRLGKRLQVTYKRHPLYLFSGDTGSSVNGNGLAGFTVMKNV